jgi:lipid-A-disaccharide synthase
MKYYIIAGEASGDLHGSNLIKALKKTDPQAEFRAWGGDLMQSAGAVLVKHYRDLAFMGFTEVLLNLRTILKNISFCKKDILTYAPDALILIDYPGFNLRIAKWAKEKKLRTVYYISPQVWAWKENRVKTIRDSVDKMLVILPFEKSFYDKWNYNVDYVGHPLVKVIDDYKSTHPVDKRPDRKMVALLPGSRKQEITVKLPIMMAVAEKFPAVDFYLAKAPGLEEDFYKPLIANHPNVFVKANRTYEILNAADAALVTSGTATLETALFGVPQIICYKGSRISYEIAKRLIKIKYIGLANLIMDKPVVKELIQHELNEANLAGELKKILYDREEIGKIKADYRALKDLLSGGGDASANAAEIIHNWLVSRINAGE